MGDLPSRSHEDDKTIQELGREIQQLRAKHEAVQAEKRQWQQRRRQLQESITQLGGLGMGAPLKGSASRALCFAKTGESCDNLSFSVEDHMQVLLQAADHQQQDALDDFRSALARRKRLRDTSNLAKESKALHDAFHIGYQGPFATINGLRLGAEATVEDYHGSNDEGGPPATTTLFAGNRVINGGSNSLAGTTVSTVRVPWSEINAALGLLALLLSSLEQKPHAGIRYRHEIVCAGSTSKIGVGRRGDEQRGGNSSAALTYYNLYSDDSFQFFGRRSFNTALQSLIQCVADAAEAIQRRDPTIHLPHPIDRSTREFTIGGLPVAYGTDGVEWTRAMKYLLTDVKQLTAYRAFGLWDVILDS